MARKREVAEGFQYTQAEIVALRTELQNEMMMLRRYNYYLEQLNGELLSCLISMNVLDKPRVYLMINRARSRAYTPEQMQEADRMAEKMNREYNEAIREDQRFRWKFKG